MGSKIKFPKPTCDLKGRKVTLGVATAGSEMKGRSHKMKINKHQWAEHISDLSWSQTFRPCTHSTATIFRHSRHRLCINVFCICLCKCLDGSENLSSCEIQHFQLPRISDPGSLLSTCSIYRSPEHRLLILINKKHTFLIDIVFYRFCWKNQYFWESHVLICLQQFLVPKVVWSYWFSNWFFLLIFVVCKIWSNLIKFDFFGIHSFPYWFF